MILNSYKSYIVASLFVRSTAVPAVTVGLSDEYLDGGGYRNIPTNVVLLYPKKLSFTHESNFITHENGSYP